MSSFASMKLEGAGKLNKILTKLPVVTSKKVVRKAVRVAQKPTLAAAKGNAKSMVGGFMGGQIAQNTKIISPKQKKGSYRLDVGISSQANDLFVVNSATGKRNYIPAALEHGHGSDKAGAAIPFMRRANDLTEPRKLGIVSKELKRGILAAAK